MLFGFDLNWLMTHCNPIAYLIDELRQIIIYGEMMDPWLFLYWLIISLALLGIGLFLMYRHENSYVKVV